MSAQKQNLPGARAKILLALERANTDLCVTEIARFACVNSSDASQALLAFSRWGWATRKSGRGNGRADDQKRAYYRITPAGSEVAHATKCSPSIRAKILTKGPDGDLATVLSALLAAHPSVLSNKDAARIAGLSDGSVRRALTALTNGGWAYSEPGAGGGNAPSLVGLTAVGIKSANKLNLPQIDTSQIPARGLYGTTSSSPPRLALAGRVLLVLDESEQPELYGLEIAKATGIAARNLYPTLAELTKDGMVQLRRETSAPGTRYHPPRKYYRLTACGIRAAQSLARMPSASVRSKGGGAPGAGRKMVLDALLDAWPSEMYGLEIAGLLGAPNQRVYVALKGLIGDGLAVSRSGPDRRVYYRLTDAGVAAAQKTEPGGRDTAKPAMEAESHQSKKPVAAGGQVMEALRSAASEMCVSEIAVALGADRRSVNGAALRLVKSGHLESRREDVNANDPRRPPRVFYRLTEAGVAAASEKAHRNPG